MKSITFEPKKLNYIAFSRFEYALFSIHRKKTISESGYKCSENKRLGFTNIDERVLQLNQ